MKRETGEGANTGQDIVIEQSIRDLIDRALAEDVGSGDVTSSLVQPINLPGHGWFLAKQQLVVCGLDIAAAVMQRVDAENRFENVFHDGDRVDHGTELGRVEGPFVSLLIAERTALNLLTHLSGIATLTARFVERIAGTTANIYDTRKTTPGLRLLEKYAVKTGGGCNHRIGLFDAILIKNNHIAACGGDIEGLISRARNYSGKTSFIDVEVETLDQVRRAVRATPDIIMLDNMRMEQIRQARELIPETIEVEVSGNVNLDNVRDIALCGVDRISIGALTHSAPAADISLNLFPRTRCD